MLHIEKLYRRLGAELLLSRRRKCDTHFNSIAPAFYNIATAHFHSQKCSAADRGYVEFSSGEAIEYEGRATNIRAHTGA